MSSCYQLADRMSCKSSTRFWSTSAPITVPLQPRAFYDLSLAVLGRAMDKKRSLSRNSYGCDECGWIHRWSGYCSICSVPPLAHPPLNNHQLRSSPHNRPSTQSLGPFKSHSLTGAPPPLPNCKRPAWPSLSTNPSLPITLSPSLPPPPYRTTAMTIMKTTTRTRTRTTTSCYPCHP